MIAGKGKQVPDNSPPRGVKGAREGTKDLSISRSQNTLKSDGRGQKCGRDKRNKKTKKPNQAVDGAARGEGTQKTDGGGKSTLDPK